MISEMHKSIFFFVAAKLVLKDHEFSLADAGDVP